MTLSHDHLVYVVSASRPTRVSAPTRLHCPPQISSLLGSASPRGILGLVPLLEAFFKGIRNVVWVTEMLLMRK